MAAVGGASSALVCVLCVLLPAVTGLQSEGTECAFTDQLHQEMEPHNRLTNELRGVVPENGTIRCSRGSRCYGLWEKRPNGEIHLVKQGCWTAIGEQQECHSDRCLVTTTPSQIQNGSYRFCCCSHDLCNANFTEAPPNADSPALRLMKTHGQVDRQTDQQPLRRRKEMVLVALVTVGIAAVLVMVLFLGYRMIKGKKKLNLSALDVMEAADEPTVDLDNLKLLELIGRGRYGAVIRGCLNDRCVAVKVFSSANQQNYTNERSIYCLPLLQQHDNIARFLTADERTTADGRPEFLIIMEYYPHGCLAGYLSLHTIDWLTCCRMTHGVTRGLAFLHTELYRADQYKPAVAHRDVTSRNVLIRADLSCVLADFGLSMRLTGSQSCHPGDDDTMAISEVGTVRYMAPEVLGGALNLRDCESALKQVDVYALGLLYWESFRRCSDLFPGEATPDYQLVFQAELGNHPSFEEMQMLVLKQKHRPRFPDAWKENTLVLRSLRETMEDCWDQDAEARLTAQCAEERLTELTLLSTHTALHNHRNLSPRVGCASSYIEDLQVGMVKNLQGEGHLASVVRTTTSRAEGAEKSRNSINSEWEQAQAPVRPAGSDHTVLCSMAESQHSCAGPSDSVCFQLTEEDLQTTKLNPKEVDKNLKGSSDENLMEHSQKQFCSTEKPNTNLLIHQIQQTTGVNCLVETPHGERGGAGGVLPPIFIPPLPKQQNLPQRPTSLYLVPKTKETSSISSHFKLGKPKSNHRQVETGVAKMNSVKVAAAAEPHLVTTVINNTSTKGNNITGNHSTAAVANGFSAGVPTLVINSTVGGGRINPAGPQVEEEDKMEGRTSSGEEHLLNPSPDEHEPLLSREQLPAKSPNIHVHHPHSSQAGNILIGRGSNSNNNNNRITSGSEVKIKVGDENLKSSEVSQGQGTIGSTAQLQPATSSGSGLLYGPSGPGPTLKTAASPCVQTAPAAEPVMFPVYTQSPEDNLQHSTTMAPVPHCKDSDSGQYPFPAEVAEVPGTLVSQEPEKCSPVLDTRFPQPTPEFPDAQASDPEGLGLEAPAHEGPGVKVPVSEETASQTETFSSQGLGTSDPDPANLHGSQTPELLQLQMGPPKSKRPERPRSLDLSLSCTSAGDVALTDDGSLSASGEKIKRRVKTPYTLKKWRPVSWVVTTDTDLDPDFQVNISSRNKSQTHISAGLQRAGSIPKINQSKSSMAVFLVGDRATATTTSDPDRMTCF